MCVVIPRWAAQLRKRVQQPIGRLTPTSLPEEELTVSHGSAAPCREGGRPPPTHQPDEDRRGIWLQTGVWGKKYCNNFGVLFFFVWIVYLLCKSLHMHPHSHCPSYFSGKTLMHKKSVTSSVCLCSTEKLTWTDYIFSPYGVIFSLWYKVVQFYGNSAIKARENSSHRQRMAIAAIPLQFLHLLHSLVPFEAFN